MNPLLLQLLFLLFLLEFKKEEEEEEEEESDKNMVLKRFVMFESNENSLFGGNY